MSGSLIPCAHCPAPAVVFDHSAGKSVCTEHDDGYGAPLAQADGLPWTEYELAQWREYAAVTGNDNLFRHEVRRWLATLDALVSK
jgi:hypothetical protein